MIPDQDHRMGTRAASKHRCLCGRFIGTDGWYDGAKWSRRETPAEPFQESNQ